MAKIHETDDVCGCASFLLTLRLDNGAAFYCGDPVMVTRFFGEGVSRAQLDWRINVRPVSIIRTCSGFSIAVLFSVNILVFVYFILQDLPI